jgi:predicted acetyltransferase
MAHDVGLVPATEADKPTIRNLLHLYLHDLSELNGRDPSPHGVFEYSRLDHYWTAEGLAEGRHAFLITVEGRIAGFALKNCWSVLNRNRDVSTVAEFFVLRKWRRRGVGRRAAWALFDLFPGAWEVRQERANIPAQVFWRATIAAYTRGRFEEIDLRSDAWDGPVQVFQADR